LAKSWAGLDKYKAIDTKNLIDDLNPRFSDLLNRQLAVNTVTLLRNKKDIIPLQNLDTLKIASLVIGTPAFGSKPVTDFQKMLGNYTAVEHFNLDENSADSTIAKVEEALKSYNLVIMGVNGQNIRPAKNYNILPKTQELVKRFSNAKTIITLFSNPYTLGKFENLENAAALVQTFQETPFTQEAAAQAIFGATPITGKLPVTVNTAFKYNDGIRPKLFSVLNILFQRL
jgi:hypothetical protein